MSLAGKKMAVVSVGSSCQTAYQVRNHVELLSLLCEDELRTRRLPFDWVICSPERSAAWLESGQPFPNSADDLAPYTHEGVFEWNARGVFFWHDFRNAQKLVDLEGTFDFTETKYRALWESFRRLGDIDRVVVVVSNIQNNLTKVLDGDFARDGFSFTLEGICRLKTAIERFLGRTCELIAVTYDDRSEAGLHGRLPAGIRVYTVGKNSSGWAGDDAAWRDIFLDYFGPAHAAR